MKLDELKTQAYIPVHKLSGHPVGDSLIFREPIPAMEHRELIDRKEAEQVIAAIKDEHDERGIDIDVLKAQLAAAERRVEGWRVETRQQTLRVMRYLDLFEDMGRAIGLPAYTTRAGAILSEPIAQEVRDIVVAAYKPRNRLVRAFRMLMRGY